MKALPIGAELGRAVDHQRFQLGKTALVEEDVQPLAGGQLAARVLRFDSPAAAAESPFLLELAQSLQPVSYRHVTASPEGKEF